MCTCPILSGGAPFKIREPTRICDLIFYSGGQPLPALKAVSFFSVNGAVLFVEGDSGLTRRISIKCKQEILL